jgi:hypothetical protein
MACLKPFFNEESPEVPQRPKKLDRLNKARKSDLAMYLAPNSSQSSNSPSNSKISQITRQLNFSSALKCEKSPIENPASSSDSFCALTPSPFQKSSSPKENSLKKFLPSNSPADKQTNPPRSSITQHQHSSENKENIQGCSESKFS